MIPKIIHYCWLSNDPYPEKIQRCIDSWKKYLPDYELMLWNFDRFPRGKSKWVDQAFDTHKYAFAADYIRLYALYNYGGIYLDSDVEVLKSFDDFLNLPYFIGQENTPLGIEAATLGCEKGWNVISDMYNRYKDREFINKDGSMNIEPMPAIFRKCIESRYELHFINDKSEFVNDDNIVNVFPKDFFSPMTCYTHTLEVTDNTYSIHHFVASWVEKKEGGSVSYKPSLIQNIKMWLGAKRRQLFYRFHPVGVISNNRHLVKAYYDYHYTVCQSPFCLGTMTVEDVLALSKIVQSKDDLKLNFIRSKESKYPVDDFFPVARFGETNIEARFIDELDPVRNVITSQRAEYIKKFNFSKLLTVVVVTNEEIKGKEYGKSVIFITPKNLGVNNQVIVEELNNNLPNKINWNNKSIIGQIDNLISKIY